jgi:hypothetical protein
MKEDAEKLLLFMSFVEYAPIDEIAKIFPDDERIIRRAHSYKKEFEDLGLQCLRSKLSWSRIIFELQFDKEKLNRLTTYILEEYV